MANAGDSRENFEKALRATDEVALELREERPGLDHDHLKLVAQDMMGAYLRKQQDANILSQDGFYAGLIRLLADEFPNNESPTECEASAELFFRTLHKMGWERNPGMALP